ncbi:DNA-binding protein [Gordonia paraffinivorans]|uniref:excisionase family DNA-binding protein n=1 Tax=Gordonia paraffinivorans TaxID=175628 RepID=UPI00144786A9|nr:excisionase family DNA-binding protein [Gordonia paraffinivorans]MBY4573980.1 DNA-binding protein [Gordonia paraffinivorans]
MSKTKTPTTDQPRRWATLQQVADHLNVTTRTVRAMVADGRLRGYRNGRKLIRIDLNEVDAAMRPMGGAR